MIAMGFVSETMVVKTEISITYLLCAGTEDV